MWVYAVVDRQPLSLPPCPGVGASPLAAVVAGPVAAVVGDVACAPAAATADDLWRHEEVIEALMQDRATLPVRYGTVAAAASDVRAALARSSAALLAGLRRVAGRVEIAVRFVDGGCGGGAAERTAVPPEAPDLALGRGAAFLMARAGAERAARGRREQRLAAIRPALARLAGLAVEHRVTVASGTSGTIAAAFLVPRQGVAVFRDAVAAIAAGDPRWAVLCTGPWPAYSFTDGAIAGVASGAADDARH
jgi:hypothetical protein